MAEQASLATHPSTGIERADRLSAQTRLERLGFSTPGCSLRVSLYDLSRPETLQQRKEAPEEKHNSRQQSMSAVCSLGKLRFTIPVTSTTAKHARRSWIIRFFQADQSQSFNRDHCDMQSHFWGGSGIDTTQMHKSSLTKWHFVPLDWKRHLKPRGGL